MSFSGDQWGRPQPPAPPDQAQEPQRRRGLGALGCYLLVIAALVVATVISFAVSRPDSRLMPSLLLILTVLAVIVPLLFRNIFRATQRNAGGSSRSSPGTA